jgi:hypothetical protein
LSNFSSNFVKTNPLLKNVRANFYINSNYTLKHWYFVKNLFLHRAINYFFWKITYVREAQKFWRVKHKNAVYFALHKTDFNFYTWPRTMNKCRPRFDWENFVIIFIFVFKYKKKTGLFCAELRWKYQYLPHFAKHFKIWNTIVIGADTKFHQNFELLQNFAKCFKILQDRQTFREVKFMFNFLESTRFSLMCLQEHSVVH